MAYKAFLCFALLIISSLSAPAHVEKQRLIFTAELIHRDSPISPFFNASQTRTQRLISALQRSSDRVNHILSNPGKSFQSPLVNYNGEYLMKVRIGSPPTEILMNVASGSDFTWLPCLDTTECTQNCSNRIFDPSKSTTFRKESCDSYWCQMTTRASCEFQDCVFPCDSRDGSCSEGNVSTDTFTLNSIDQQPVSIPGAVFICGYRIAGDYPGVGFLGLGKGSLSLVSKIDHLIDGTFSYCLAPFDSKQASKIIFGSKGAVSGTGVVSAKLQLTSAYTLYFYGFSVGGQQISYMTGLDVDSGVLFTQLPIGIYSNLERLVRNATLQEPVDSDTALGLNLCYQYTADFNPPVIKMKFAFHGGYVQLSTWNSFIRTDENTVCLAFVPSSLDEDGIYGSWQQMNFLVGYDLKNGTISFKKTDCSHYV